MFPPYWVIFIITFGAARKEEKHQKQPPHLFNEKDNSSLFNTRSDVIVSLTRMIKLQAVKHNDSLGVDFAWDASPSFPHYAAILEDDC